MTVLVAIGKAWWLELFHMTEFPTGVVAENLAVESEALTLAKQMRKSSPEYNGKVLEETARLLGVSLSN